MRIRRPTAGPDELAAFAEAVRAAVPEPPGPGFEAGLVSRLAQEASAASAGHGDQPTEQLPGLSVGAGLGWRPRLALVAQVAVIIALLPVVAAGLAFAGVTLPQPARDAFDRVGIDLPHQPSDTDSSDSRPGDRRTTDSASGGSRSTGVDSRTEGANGGGDGGGGGRSGHRDQGSSGGGATAPTESPGHGQGEPQHGAPAPIVPPGQGGTPPGQGGASPGNSGSAPGQTGTAPGQAKQTTADTGGGPPGGVPPGQANK